MEGKRMKFLLLVSLEINVCGQCFSFFLTIFSLHVKNIYFEMHMFRIKCIMLLLFLKDTWKDVLEVNQMIYTSLVSLMRPINIDKKKSSLTWIKLAILMTWPPTSPIEYLRMEWEKHKLKWGYQNTSLHTCASPDRHTMQLQPQTSPRQSKIRLFTFLDTYFWTISKVLYRHCNVVASFSQSFFQRTTACSFTDGHQQNVAVIVYT